VKLSPRYTAALINKGNCYYMLQDYTNAINTFKIILDYEPMNQTANRNLSHLYGIAGNTQLQQLHDRRARGE